MLALYCTSLANAIGGKVGVQFPQRLLYVPSFSRGTEAPGRCGVGGLCLLTAVLLRGCTQNVVRDPPMSVSLAAESREPWTC